MYNSQKVVINYKFNIRYLIGIKIGVKIAFAELLSHFYHWFLIIAIHVNHLPLLYSTGGGDVNATLKISSSVPWFYSVRSP